MAIVEGPNTVAPTVLDQAVGPMLEAGEQIVCAAFVRLASGPHLGCGKDGLTRSQLAAVTDRRLVKVVAWWPNENSYEGPFAMTDWQQGEVLRTGWLSRRSLWLGQIASMGRYSDILDLRTADGGRETVEGEGVSPLNAALRQVLAGPHRHALPPEPPIPPTPLGGWFERGVAILRPSSRWRGWPT